MTGVRRVLLVGFMASGKTSVGVALARALGWSFHDVDAAVEAEEGRSVARIFAESGEAHFRSAEARVAQRLLALDRVVLGSGGGWAAVPGRLDALPTGTLSVWLKVSPEEAVRRAGARPGARPLLDVSDPLAAARRLAGERAPLYARCALEVDTEGRTVEDVAARIVEWMGPETLGSQRGGDGISG